MARTVDIAAHLIRREAFVSAATRLFQTKGYDEASIQDILDTVGASRGAFYHYFDSKGALLDAVVEQMVEEALRVTDPQLEAPGLTALERLRALVDGIAAWKTEHAELALAVAETWLSDHNALVRERFRRLVSQRLTPRLALIVEQGSDEGSFVTPDPEGTAQVLVALWLSLNITATEQYLATRAGTIAFEDGQRTQVAYLDAFDRVLGARPGSFPRVDPDALRPWFGPKGTTGPKGRKGPA